MARRRAARLSWTAGAVAMAAALSGQGAALAADGAAVFEQHCAACHQAGGVGAPGLAPPLVSKHVAATARDPHYAALVVLNGLSGNLVLDDGSTMSGFMPPVGATLSDEEVAAVVGYVLETLNGAKTSLNASSVTHLRSQKHTAKALRSMREDMRP